AARLRPGEPPQCASARRGAHAPRRSPWSTRSPPVRRRSRPCARTGSPSSERFVHLLTSLSLLASQEVAERLLDERAEGQAMLGREDARALHQVGWQLEGCHVTSPLRGRPFGPRLACHLSILSSCRHVPAVKPRGLPSSA